MIIVWNIRVKIKRSVLRSVKLFQRHSDQSRTVRDMVARLTWTIREGGNCVSVPSIWIYICLGIPFTCCSNLLTYMLATEERWSGVRRSTIPSQLAGRVIHLAYVRQTENCVQDSRNYLQSDGVRKDTETVHLSGESTLLNILSAKRLISQAWVR